MDSRGLVTKKNLVGGYALIVEMANHSHQWDSDKGKGEKKKVVDYSREDLATLIAKIDEFGRNLVRKNQRVHALQVGCDNVYAPSLMKRF